MERSFPAPVEAGPDRSLLDPADARPERRRTLCAWLDLQRALASRPQHAVRALAAAGEPRAALRRAGLAPSPPAWLDAAVQTLRRVGAVAVPLGAAAYPERLAPLADAAPLLLVRGDVAALSAPAVAVVGARAASAYGRAVARAFASDLARAGLVVVSGLATGIDAVAHEAALAAGGRTVAVMATGPDRIHPRRHRALAERIVRAGALVTEFAPGTAPRPGYFPLRNRLISGLSLAVLVVEARLRSGSLTTAAHAAQQGVEVYAVPGPLGAPTSAGTNQLLFDGAHVALSPAVVLERLLGSGALPPPAPAQTAGVGPPRGIAARIQAALEHEPLTRDALARRLGCAPERLALALLELELSGAVVEDRDGRLRVVSLGGTRGL